MKKLFLFTLLAIAAISFNACSKDETWPDDSPIIEFKDSYFLEALVSTDNDDGSKIDKNGDGKISEKEASVVRLLTLSDFNIRCVDEISYFTALISLGCNNTQLTSLDVSRNTELKELVCRDNTQLTSLDVSKNTKLECLYCDNTQLTSLDMSRNTELEELFCRDNTQLTSLDVSKNTKLTHLDCDNNQLTSLDVSKNTELGWLYCNNNQLTSLDLSKNTELNKLNCSGNNLKSVIFQRNIDYRLLPSLEAIWDEYGDIITYVYVD